MNFTDALSNASIAVAIMMVAVWLISLLIRDVGIVDIGWGIGFVLIAWVTFISSKQTTRCWLISILVTTWGLRLAGYLAKRNLGKGEDYRYVAMRERHGSRFPTVSLFTVFGLQGVVMLIVALPILTGQTQQADAPIDVITMAGCVVWLVGFIFEAGGDWQLARFKSNPQNKGKVLDRGLWKYTRHPNYFGDFAIWWGTYLIAFGSGGTWWSAVGPAVMSVFLMKFSGVGLLEKNLTRKPGYADYIARTNAFFPWFPKAGSQESLAE
ncbi:MAG: DUF1295 domain-containing protein [Planctomycetaceae bacterium]